MSVRAFDNKASAYDLEFTHTYVGSYQRRQVHHILSRYFSGKHDLNILEVNCGTGEDISLLKKFGRVLATDVSPEMLKVALQKNPETTFEMLDLSKPISLNEKYDLIFSNFGGLNCINHSRLSELNSEFANHLNPGGHLIIVTMHRWSFMEWFYFMLKLNFKKAVRRIKGVSTFNHFPVYYYSKSVTKNIFNSFNLVEAKPIGVLLCGEYMNGIGRKFKMGEKWISWAWRLLGADHFLYAFKKKDS